MGRNVERVREAGAQERQPMKEKPRKTSVWGRMVVHTEDGIDKICKEIEHRERAGEKPWTVEDHRRLREEVFGKPENNTTD